MWLLTSAALASPTTASWSSWSSDPEEVEYLDQAPVFTTVQFDTGYWPSSTDPIAIRFYLTPTGGVTTDLHGTSAVAWPPLSHHVEAEPGQVTLDAGLEIGAEIHLDLLGLYTGTVPLVTRSIAFRDGAPTDDLVLPDSVVPSIHLGDQVGSFPPLDYNVSVIPGISLVAGVDILPSVGVDVAGTELTTVVGDQTLVQATADAWSTVDPDPTRPGELGLVSTWSGQLDSVLSLILEPHVDVDTPVGTFNLVQFPIPVDLVDGSEARTSIPVFLVHPLPVLQTADQSHDFGPVAVGSAADWDVTLDNLGQLVLQGADGIDGDLAFSVWPDGVAAVPLGADGLAVTFAPTATGPFSATLWLETNDPYTPRVELTLTGTGVGGDPVPDSPKGDGSPQSYCGCASSGPAGAWPATVLLLGVGSRSRRRVTGPSPGGRPTAA